MLTLAQVQEQIDRVAHVVDGITFRWNVTNVYEGVSTEDEADYRDAVFPVYFKRVGYFVQMEYDEADIDTGKLAVQRTRKWHVPLEAAPDEVLQSCLKAALGSAEHRVREFLVDGVRAYGPHQKVDNLIKAEVL